MAPRLRDFGLIISYLICVVRVTLAFVSPKCVLPSDDVSFQLLNQSEVSLRAVPYSLLSFGEEESILLIGS